MDRSAQIAKARQAGYSDAEIISYLGTSDPAVGKAKSAGYGDAEIIGYLTKAPAAKPAPKAVVPKPAAKPAPMGLMDQVTGFMANVNRGSGLGDELAAVGNTALSTVKGAMGLGPQVIKIDPKGGDASMQGLSQLRGEFGRQMGRQRAVEDQYAAEKPKTAAFGRGLGTAATAAVPTAQAIQGSNLGMNMLRGATTAATQAAGYGLADRGSVLERAKAANASAFNPLTLGLGAAGGALATPRAQRAPKELTPQQRNVQILEDAQVFMTPGRKGGAFAKNAEDLAKRAPILGAAIKGADARSVDSLNRAVADRALEPVGAYLPKGVATGHDSVSHVAKALGKVYDDAADMVPATALDEPFDSAAQQIGVRLKEQPQGVRSQFDSIVENRLEHLRGKTVTGAQIREVQSQIGKLAADFSASDDGAQRALGGALDDLSDELANVIGRNNPEAAALIDKANTGWSVYTRIRNAASKAKGGIFTPGQLATSVRTLDRSVGKGNVAKGQAVLQDLSNAAWETLPDTYGNPGTADALSAMSLGGAMVAPQTAPVAIPTAMGLAAASTPYFMMGRKVVERIPGNATKAQLQAADRELAVLMAKDPSIAALRRQVAARLSRAGGAAGASLVREQGDASRNSLSGAMR